MIKRTLLFLLLAPAAVAQYTTIVPVAGRGTGVSSGFGAVIWVTNLSSVPATIRVRDWIPATQPQKCSEIRSPLTLAARATTQFTPLCASPSLYAFTLDSDQPLAVRDDMQIAFGSTFTSHQIVDTLSDWLPANRDFDFPLIYMRDPVWRSNLFVVNPNAFAIDVDIHLDRLDLVGHADRRFTVPAGQVALFALVPVPGTQPPPPPGIIDPVADEGMHGATIHASGKFFAGISSISSNPPDAIFTNPILLQP